MTLVLFRAQAEILEPVIVAGVRRIDVQAQAAREVGLVDEAQQAALVAELAVDRADRRVELALPSPNGFR